MTNLSIILSSMFVCLSVYLFATAPPELPDLDDDRADDRAVDVSNVFDALNAINDTARLIYTQRIVGKGKEAGLAFGEDWAEPSVDKGPLPALFLRLVANQMESKPPQLGLYLGSDEPINKSNLVSGSQADAFTRVKETRSSVLLESADAGFVAMYPDVASAKPCVDCHNEHPDSPKTDWKLDDVMGATTWTYPHGSLGSAEYLDVTEAFYLSIREAYQAYLDKVETFQNSVVINDQWPEKDNLVLPDAQTFIKEVQAESAVSVLNDLVLTATNKFQTMELEAMK